MIALVAVIGHVGAVEVALASVLYHAKKETVKIVAATVSEVVVVVCDGGSSFNFPQICYVSRSG